MRSGRAEYLVVGAGPAGLTLARLLACKGRQVLVVDPQRRAQKRLELIAPAALDTVAALGLAPLLQDPAIARPCLGIRRRWGSAEPAYEDFLRHPYRTGYVVDRARFDQQLAAAAAAAGVQFHVARAVGVVADGVEVQAGSGERGVIAADHAVIDASGRAAIIARRRGARIRCRDRMIAELMEASTTEAGIDAATWLDVATDAPGWCYRIEGPCGQAQTWRIRRSGTAPASGVRLRVDASAGLLSEAAGEGWMAIGDAASAFDPIASQGLFHALSSAQVAAGALLSAPRLSLAAARLYSDAVATAFAWSEAGRSAVYQRELAAN